ncbi:MAG: hypothetical protein A2951_01750 [Candidatus Buchananbacteria bacterium RIFCSPLOWO2_01_FULL_56_15]|uniref:Uncharacterized protein n=1 Tax=Candidatus Buchananbacteria bacterium RIFCSPLOWO2_01_FULL_56_15 TaxID=1797547 RepID=A0A1G1YR52_9BACT|nr:MAG: hypothetical protein A2951_01750 [Candidatus Buchananbacteria bacterium RIFCSPLOWO2_01_FULL_56_15]
MTLAPEQFIADYEALQRSGLDCWFNYVALSPHLIPLADRRKLLDHGCLIAVASAAEVQAARSVGYPHDRGFIVYPPGAAPDCWP